MSLRANVALSALVFVLVGIAVVALCLPLISVIQDLSAETKPPARGLPLLTRIVGSAPAAVVTAGLSVAALALAVVGLRRERVRRRAWMGLVVADAGLVLTALGICLFALAWSALFHSLGFR